MKCQFCSTEVENGYVLIDHMEDEHMGCDEQTSFVFFHTGDSVDLAETEYSYVSTSQCGNSINQIDGMITYYFCKDCQDKEKQ